MEQAMKSTIHKISRKFGYRGSDRFSIPGAKISWKSVDQDCFPDEKLPLSDVSVLGLSLLTNNPPEVNADITLRITVPKKSGSLDLRGKVVHSTFRGPGLTYEYRVGVEFNPFSENKGENPPEMQKAIEELEQVYGKRLYIVRMKD